MNWLGCYMRRDCVMTILMAVTIYGERKRGRKIYDHKTYQDQRNTQKDRKRWSEGQPMRRPKFVVRQMTMVMGYNQSMESDNIASGFVVGIYYINTLPCLQTDCVYNKYKA